MPSLQETLEVSPSSVKDIPSFAKMLQKFYQQLARLVNGNLGFGDGVRTDNINGAWFIGTTPVISDTEFVVTHNLGRIPVGYLVVYQNAAGSIYDSMSAWSTMQIFLKCSSPEVGVKLFII
jgi:hypothetical protein